MWIIEGYNGVRMVCATKEIALKEVLRILKEFYIANPDDEQELKDYLELIGGYLSSHKDGFGVVGFYWVSKVEFIDK